MPREAPRLLLAEEDPLLAELTAFRLELLGYRVAVAMQGQQILQRLEAGEIPDLILLDTVLPDMDGIELVNRLSSDARFSRVPILVFSTDADLNTVQRAHTAGAKDYLVTPYDPVVLERKVAGLLRAARAVPA